MFVKWNVKAGAITEPMEDKYFQMLPPSLAVVHKRFPVAYTIKSPKFQRATEIQMKKKVINMVVREVRAITMTAKTILIKTAASAMYALIVKNS